MGSHAHTTGPGSGTPGPFTERWARRLVLIFAVLSLVAVLVAVLIIVDVNGRIAVQNTPTAAGVANSTDSPEAALLYAIRGGLIILLAVMTSSFCLIIYLFARHVAGPIAFVLESAREMSRGNLAVNVPPEARDSVGELGRMVNEVAADFQEVLLLTGATVGRIRSRVDRLDYLIASEGDAHEPAEAREELQELRQDLSLLHSVVNEFRLYQTCFDGQKVIPTGDREEGGR